MSDIRIDETCSCGATFTVTGSTYRSTPGGGSNGEHRSAEEMVERWRADHRHEAPPALTPEPYAGREVQLDALVDMAHPRGVDQPTFGFVPRITEPADG